MMVARTHGEAVHHVLWTSGWDSTFRVLQLVLVERRPVQPLYVMDEERASTPHELAAMERIRAGIAGRDPAAAALLAPTRTFRKADLARDPGVSRAFATIKGEKHLGAQYEWLGWLAEQEGLATLELGVHKDDRFACFLGHADFEAYRRFAFPLLGVTKVEMGEAARAYGFADLMEETWFCFTPLRGRPCGSCVPCRQTREEGMGRRVPPRSFFDRVVWFHARRILRGLRRRLPGRAAHG